MKIAAIIVVGALALGGATLLRAGGTGSTPTDGLPNMAGRYEGKLKLKFTQQLTDGEKGKDKADIVLYVYQTGGTLEAFMSFDGEPPPVCFKNALDDLDTIGLSGAVGNRAFSLCTSPGSDPEIIIVGKAKQKPSTVKLSATGVFIGFANPEVGTLTFAAKRTGDILTKTER